VSLSCPKTSSWLGVFVESVLKFQEIILSDITTTVKFPSLPPPTLHFLREAFFIVPPLPKFFRIFKLGKALSNIKQSNRIFSHFFKRQYFICFGLLVAHPPRSHIPHFMFLIRCGGIFVVR
jgi:hypothetical protein